jgi:hypothetical protein
MAVEQINPVEPRRSGELDVKGADTTNTTQLSREGSNELSSTGDTPLVKRNWYQQIWDSLKTPGSAMQIITAALLAIAIGLAVSTTVSDIPEAVPVILEIPGSLWLRALRATGKPNSYTAKHLLQLVLMYVCSVALDRRCYDPCCAELDEHGERRWKVGSPYHYMVCEHDDSRHHHQHHSCRSRLEAFDDSRGRRHAYDD